MSHSSCNPEHNCNSFSVADAMKFFVPIGPSIDATIVEGMKLFQMLDSSEKSEGSTSNFAEGSESRHSRLSSTKTTTSTSICSPSRSLGSRVERLISGGSKDRQSKNTPTCKSNEIGQNDRRKSHQHEQSRAEAKEKHGRDNAKEAMSSSSSVSVRMRSDECSSLEARVSASAMSLYRNHKLTSGKTAMPSAPFTTSSRWSRNDLPAAGTGSSREGDNIPARQSSLQKYRRESANKSKAIENSNNTVKGSFSKISKESGGHDKRDEEWQDRHDRKGVHGTRLSDRVNEKYLTREKSRGMYNDQRRSNDSNAKQRNDGISKGGSGTKERKIERTGEQEDRLAKGHLHESNANPTKTKQKQQGKGGEFSYQHGSDDIGEVSSNDNFQVEYDQEHRSEDHHRTKTDQKLRHEDRGPAHGQPQLPGKSIHKREDPQNKGNDQKRLDSEGNQRSTEHHTRTDGKREQDLDSRRKDHLYGEEASGPRWPLQKEIERQSRAEPHKSRDNGVKASHVQDRQINEFSREESKEGDIKGEQRDLHDDKMKKQQDKNLLKDGKQGGFKDGLISDRDQEKGAKMNHAFYEHKQEYNRDEAHYDYHEEHTIDDSRKSNGCPLYFDVGDDSLASTPTSQNGSDSDYAKAAKPEERQEVKKSKGRKMIKVMWAATKVTFYNDDTRVYEIMNMSDKPPQGPLPTEVDGVFVMSPPVIKTIKP